MNPRHTERPIGRATTRRGATVVEFAVVSPLFLLFIFGLIEFGRYVMVQQALTNAAREGSRTAALVTTSNPELVNTAVHDGLRGVFSRAGDVDPVSVTITPSGLSSLDPGTPIEVNVSVNAGDASWLPLGLSRVVGRISATSVHARE
jgi:Flp pilus assembly protein TadG